MPPSVTPPPAEQWTLAQRHGLAPEAKGGRLGVLDGWRGVSILLVLAGHMLPLGPKQFGLNDVAGLAGMALFFTLSGFLITSTLHKHPAVLPFAIRRLCRILPLAYVATAVYLLIQGRTAWRDWAAHLLFTLNYDHAHMTPLTGHFWSLCVEVHFYLFVGVLVLLSGSRGLMALPILGLAVTANRVLLGVPYHIETHLRVDEILAGSLLALLHAGALGRLGRAIAGVLGGLPLLVWLALLAASCHSASGPLQYLRPYAATALVGHTLFVGDRSFAILKSRVLRYVAEISYALYVIHPLSMAGWLGEGERVVRYLKRPICFAISFGLAHLSTFYLERPFQAWGKETCRRTESARRGAVETAG